MSKTRGERLERRNATMENFTHLKIVHEPVLKSNVISSKLSPLDHGYIFLCVRACVHVCLCVFAFHTGLPYSVSIASCVKHNRFPLIHKCGVWV